MKKLATIFWAVVMMLLLCVTAFAENSYSDTYYYKENLSEGEWGGTGARYKTTTSKVYVVPTSAPNSRTRLQTLCYVNGAITNKAVNKDIVLINTNPETKYGVTNRVVEDGDYTNTLGVSMWLGVAPLLGSGSLSGRWSPDWTGQGNVQIV